MPKKKKEVGKIVVKKKVHRTPSIKVRGDIILVAVVIALIIGGIAYIIIAQKPATESKTVSPYKTLYKGLKVVFDEKNKTATLDLYYQVRGSIEYEGFIVSAKDLLQFRVFYFNQTVGKGNSTKTIAGYASIPLGGPYVYPLLNLTGYTDLLDNASQLILNLKRVKNNYNVTVTTRSLGETTLHLKGFKKDFTCRHYIYMYNVSNGGKVRHVKVEVWYENSYGVPVKAIVNVDGNSLTFKLVTVALNYLKPT